jgi:hypothetical protein
MNAIDVDIDIAPSPARRQRARELDAQIAQAHDDLHTLADQADLLGSLVATRLRGPRGSQLLRIVAGILCLPPFVIGGGVLCWFLAAMLK